MQAAAFLALTFLLTGNAGTYQVSVRTLQSVNAACGETVTLQCSIDKNVMLMDYQWTDGNRTLCNTSGTVEDVSTHMRCEYTDNHLTLTIRQAKPSNSGTYFCKLFTNSDHKVSTTTLHVSECNSTKGNSQGLKDKNHACAAESNWMSLLASFTLLLSLMSDSTI